VGSVLDMGAVTYRLSKANDVQTKAYNSSSSFYQASRFTDRRTDHSRKTGEQASRIQNIKSNVETKIKRRFSFVIMENEFLVRVYSR
jgi:TPP-dependent trihydroxycyclohexane-1,2-dione (THcHDO) dehydratase